MNLVKFRNGLLLFTVGCFIILNEGFMQLRIPPGSGGSGAPVGELVLIIALCSINHMKVMPQFMRSIFIWPLLLWWVLGIARAAAAFPEHGFWAIRDAAHVIESLYLYVGFAMAIKADQIERVFRWLPKILLIVGFYTLLYPFRDELREFSPTVVAAAGEARSLFFQFQGISLTALLAVAYLLIFQPRKAGPWVVLVAAILTGFVFMFFQSRTVYLQIFALSMVLSITHGRAFRRSGTVICILIAALMALPALGIEMKGRLGEVVSIEFVLNHIIAIVGVSGEGVEGAAAGLSLRTFWWLQIWRDVTSDTQKLLFGLGYGEPLVNFIGDGIVVREPHNSYISIFARIGVVGLAAYLMVAFLLLRAWRRAYVQCGRMGWKLGQDRLLLLLIFFLFTWIVATNQDTMERPYHTIPFYFMWGVTLAFGHNLKRGIYRPVQKVRAVRIGARAGGDAHPAPGGLGGGHGKPASGGMIPRRK